MRAGGRKNAIPKHGRTNLDATRHRRQRLRRGRRRRGPRGHGRQGQQHCPLLPSPVHPVRQEGLPGLPQGCVEPLNPLPRRHSRNPPVLTRRTGYLKAVKAALQEKGADAETITAFEKGAQTYVKEKLLPNFKDLEFYTGESMNPDGL